MTRRATSWSEGQRDEDDRDERERRPKERDEHEHARADGQQEQVGEAEDQAEDEGKPDLDQDQHDLRAKEASKRPTNRALNEQQGVGVAIRHDAADRAGDRLWICHGVERQHDDDEQRPEYGQDAAGDHLGLIGEPLDHGRQRPALNILHERRQVHGRPVDPDRVLDIADQGRDRGRDRIGLSDQVRRFPRTDLRDRNHEQGDAPDDRAVGHRNGEPTADVQPTIKAADQRADQERE